MAKNLYEELETLEEQDEMPLSTRAFAKIMRYLVYNHLAHMQASITRCQWNDWILFGALGLLISIGIAMLTILLTMD